MQAPNEGSRVAYVGDGEEGVNLGDEGKVVSSAGSGSHVLWDKTASITLTFNADLVELPEDEPTNDSLDGDLVSFSARKTMDEEGKLGLFTAMIEEGHTMNFTRIAEAAMEKVIRDLHADPSVQTVVAQLEPDEAADFVHFAAISLIQDAFGVE